MNRPINFWLHPDHEKTISTISHKFFLKSRSALIGAFLAQEKYSNFKNLKIILEEKDRFNNSPACLYTSVYLDSDSYLLIKKLSKEQKVSMSFFITSLVNFYLSNSHMFNPFEIYQ